MPKRTDASEHTHDYVGQPDGTEVCDCGAAHWADGSDLAFPPPHARLLEDSIVLDPETDPV